MLLEQADDVAEVFVVIADENGNAVPGRLDDVVSTALHEAASNKCDIANLVERGEFPDGIEEQDSSDDRLAAPERALPVTHADTLEQLNDVWKTFWMTRRQNHDRFRVTGKDVAKCGEQKGFFGFERAATDQDRASVGFGEVTAETFDDRESGWGSDIKFEVAT